LVLGALAKGRSDIRKISTQAFSIGGMLNGTSLHVAILVGRQRSAAAFGRGTGVIGIIANGILWARKAGVATNNCIGEGSASVFVARVFNMGHASLGCRANGAISTKNVGGRRDEQGGRCHNNGKDGDRCTIAEHDM
jgi:hypothetical protein